MPRINTFVLSIVKQGIEMVVVCVACGVPVPRDEIFWENDYTGELKPYCAMCSEGDKKWDTQKDQELL